MRDCVSRTFEDDTGQLVSLPDSVDTVVSLVPSLTDAIATSAPGLLVGATDWCTHPADLSVTRIGGTKNPRVDDIAALRPDVVIANNEENRLPDIAALRERDLPVWMTAPRTLPDALDSLDRMLRFACGVDRPAWLDAATAAWEPEYDGVRLRAVVPIWRRPWMVLGRDTFAGDVLARLGIDNAVVDSTDRYPRMTLGELRKYQPEIVVLPDEPYSFGWEDGPEAFADWGVPVACVSGRHLTWYGPSLVEAREILQRQLAVAH
jgi:ABC-type Fe3+-hydroxamate transport system substrate-binding protein